MKCLLEAQHGRNAHGSMIKIQDIPNRDPDSINKTTSIKHMTSDHIQMTNLDQEMRQQQLVRQVSENVIGERRCLYRMMEGRKRQQWRRGINIEVHTHWVYSDITNMRLTC